MWKHLYSSYPNFCEYEVISTMRHYIRDAAQTVRDNRDLRGPILGALAYGGIQLAGHVISNITGDPTVADIATYTTDVASPAVGIGYLLSQVGPRTPDTNAINTARDVVLCLGSAAMAGLIGQTVGDYNGSIDTLNTVSEISNAITQDHTTGISALLGGLSLPAFWGTRAWFNR